MGIRACATRKWRRRIGLVLAVMCLFTSPFKAEAGDPLHALFVSSGYYWQESDIYNHLVGLGFTVTVKKGYKVKGSTDLSPYGLVIVTGFDTSLTYSGIQKIKAEGVPLLIIEYWDFWYSYQFDLLQWDSGDFYGTDTVELIDDTHPITAGLDPTLQVHSNPWNVLYGADIYSLGSDVTPLIYSWPAADEAAVIVNDDLRRAATGIYDTTYYTGEAWELLDRMLAYVSGYVEVEETWSYTAPIFIQPFGYFSLTASGDMIASTRNGDVYKIDSSGTSSLIVDVPNTPLYHRVKHDPTGETFGVLGASTFSLYDATGASIATLPFDAAGLLKIPSAERIFLLQTERIGIGEYVFTDGQIIDHGGIIQATFPIDNLKSYQAVNDYLFFATKDEIVRLSADGVEQWRVSAALREFDAALNQDRVIAESRPGVGLVHHYTDGALTATHTVSNHVTNVSISPNGEFSVATTKTGLQIYVGDAPMSFVDLPVEFVLSVDVSDNGEIVVGGLDTSRISKLFLLNRWGQLLWEETLMPDNDAWRPEVQFTPDGEGFAARTKIGFIAYNIDRSF